MIPCRYPVTTTVVVKTKTEPGLPYGTTDAAEKTTAALRRSYESFTESIVGLDQTILDVYPWGLPRDQVHFMVKSNTDLIAKDLSARRAFYFAQHIPKAPSEGTTKSQPSHALLYGRPSEHIIPPTLFDSTLGQFRHDVFNIVPEATDRGFFYRLRNAMIQSYPDERARETRLMDLLSEILPGKLAKGKIEGYQFESDGECYSASKKSKMRWEWQGNLMSRFRITIWNNAGASASKIRKSPLGAFMSVSAAVMVEIPIVELITCAPLQAHSTNVDQVRAGERLIAALRVASLSLKNRYTTLFADIEAQPDYPHPRHYTPLNQSSSAAFKYVSAIPDTRVYKAKDDSGQIVYIKYTTRYSRDAHEAASALGLAPRLLAFETIYGWNMVVMQDLSEEYQTLSELKSARAPNVAKIKQDVRQALSRLHDSGYVHGDVRDVNLLVHKTTSQIKFVDWDWAGKAGSVRYPHTINPEVLRPSRAVGGAEILKEDDVAMVELLIL
ncbi:hypothetical protein C8R45DRAFT_1154720 [Mycena sanguinolenta]|nr:hypothetical protein C8R45DRAFT_1154720 [Mycena sanguinolenta]